MSPPHLNPDDNNLMEAATALAELRKTHMAAIGAAASASSSSTPRPTMSRNGKFPMRMHALLTDPQVHDAITWLPHGRSFVILRPDKLASRVLPLYFSEGKSEKGVRYPSFTRKLNRWGFRQISNGPDSGAFYHDLFLRDDVDKARGMVCAKSRKKDAKSVSSSSTDSTMVKPMVSAAVTVSTNGVSRSLPPKKRRGFCGSGMGIPSNVEMKPNNTSLLSETASAHSYESNFSDADDKVSTVSKDSNSAPAVIKNDVYILHQTAKESLARYFEQAKASHVIPSSASSTSTAHVIPTNTKSTLTAEQVSAQQAAMASAKEALARNFQEQYRAYALASLLKNSQLAMAARGISADSNASTSGSPGILSRPNEAIEIPLKQAQEETSGVRTLSASPATQAHHCEAVKAAKSALYEAYRKAIS